MNINEVLLLAVNCSDIPIKTACNLSNITGSNRQIHNKSVCLHTSISVEKRSLDFFVMTNNQC